MPANIEALRQRAPAHPSRERYTAIARILTSQTAATADDGVRWVRELAAELGIHNLQALGLSAGERPLMIEKALQASSMKANPIALSVAELSFILSDAGLA